MNEFTFTKEELLAIILGKVQYRKCPCCDNHGLEYWDENGMGVGPRRDAQWFSAEEAAEFMKNKKGFSVVKK